MALCALCVSLTFYFRIQLEDQGLIFHKSKNTFSAYNLEPIHAGNSWGTPLACGLILVLGSVSKLASLASSIVISKDWMFILANGDQEQLASEITVFEYHSLIAVILFSAMNVTIETDH